MSGAAVSASTVQELRLKTGAGMMDCKKALTESQGDVEKAVEILRKKGIASAEKKAGREAKQGSIVSYIHGGGRIGVMVEVNCETDFVARNEAFQDFSKDIAMHIAATNPAYLNRDQVPSGVLDKEKEILTAQAKEQGKPDNVIEKIVQGRVEKFYSENCLMNQPFVKNPDITIEEYLKQTIAKVGENILVNRFVRFELGQAAA